MVSTRRLISLGIVFGALLALVFGRTVYFHFAQADAKSDEYYSEMPIGTRRVSPMRGMIIDRGGNVLVTTRPAFNIRARTRSERVDRQKPPDAANLKFQLVMTDASALAPDLALITGRSVDELRQRLSTLAADYAAGKVAPTLIQANLPLSVTEEYSPVVKSLRERGIEFEETTLRGYPQGALAGPLLGFVSMQPKGYGGIEGYYDPLLRGAQGEVIRRSLLDLITATVEVDGATIELTLDAALQNFIEDKLTEAVKDYKAAGGTIIVMDSRTGAVYASASWPGYAPGRATDIATASGLDGLRDPAVTDAYEPGSVMKLVTLAAALDNGTITANQTFNDTGRFEAAGRMFFNDRRRSFGRVNLQGVIEHSINVVTAQVAKDMTPTAFYRYMSLFGAGQRTGIDVANETVGIVRTPETAQWSRADLATNSFGQGIAFSPMQVINAINVIANDGVMMKPYLVQQVRYADGNVETRRPVPVRRVIAPEVAQQFRAIVGAATKEADAKALVPGYSLAGKTGTANWYQRGKKADTTIQTFVGMIPATQPRLTILVKLDEPNVAYAKDSAVPLFRQVAERAVQILGVPPDVVK